jgi:hypothetical protein
LKQALLRQPKVVSPWCCHTVAARMKRGAVGVGAQRSGKCQKSLGASEYFFALKTESFLCKKLSVFKFEYGYSCFAVFEALK